MWSTQLTSSLSNVLSVETLQYTTDLNNHHSTCSRKKEHIHTYMYMYVLPGIIIIILHTEYIYKYTVLLFYIQSIYKRKLRYYSDVIHSFDWKSAVEHDGGV